jgi:hypothetical protein
MVIEPAPLPDRLALAGRRVPLAVLVRPAAGAVRLRANGLSGRVELVMPSARHLPHARQLLVQSRDWLEQQIARWPHPQPLCPDALVPFDGEQLRIAWDAGAPRTPVVAGGTIRVGGPIESLAPRLLRWLKARAREDLVAATHHYAQAVGRSVARISIGDPTSRWGSCAAQRPGGATIAYSWRLILAPAHVRHGIAAHEAAHLVHANHSPAFHALNRQLDPHAKDVRRWLAAHGPALHWVGRSE